MTVILDNGHGKGVKGKQSPDGRLLEFEFNRDIVCRLIPMLEKSGVDYHILVPEIEDIPLMERVRRANEFYAKNKHSFLISIHANAGGGTGWEVFTSPGETESDKIAQIFFEHAKKEFPDFRMRADLSDGDDDKEAKFTIITRTMCPAILTENFFMDHPVDLEFIISDEGRQRVAEMHYRAILTYINLNQ